jgi:cell shape-determining protein MreC
MARRSPSPRTLLLLTTIVLLTTSLAPTRFTKWLGAFRDVFEALVMPASGPVTAVSAWLRPAEEYDRFEGSTEAQLAAQVRELELGYLRLLDENDRLNRLLEDMGRYTQPVRKIEATRQSANLASGTFDVSRGKRDGVRGGTVAVARGSEQLVGIVTSAGPLTSTVHALTDRRLEPNLMVGVVVPEDQVLDQEGLAMAPRAQFRPSGDALFAEAVGKDDAERMAPGSLVRLSDETWPTAAQMLILGRVTRVDRTDEPLFYNVTVEPLTDVKRLRSVILFIPEAGAQDAGESEPGVAR